MATVKVYVASSWKTVARQQLVVWSLREAGHSVYDFRNPASSFAWKEAATPEQLRDPRRFRDEVLTHPLARAGFEADMGALRSAEATVLVLPCGRSAHLELGWGARNAKSVVLLDDPVSEPELMYLACDAICVTVAEVVQVLAVEERNKSRTFGIWVEGMPDGMIEPHWLPNDECTSDWIGTEEEAIKRARYVGVAVEYKSRG